MRCGIKTNLLICGCVGLLSLLLVSCSSLRTARGQVEDYLIATYGEESSEYKAKMQVLRSLIDADGTEEEKIAKIQRQFPHAFLSPEGLLILKKAEKGDIEAQYQLGKLYAEGGKNAPRNMTEAVKWFTKAAEQSHPGAILALGNLYGQGADEISRNDKKALEWYLKGAVKGDKTAQFWAGNFYLHGRGTKVDRKEALKWSLKSAEQGFADGQYQTGLIYMGNEDYRSAVKWFQTGAEQKHEKSIKILLLAKTLVKAAGGDSKSQYQVAVFYDKGLNEAEQNHVTAIKWFTKSAEQGFADAQYELGEHCFTGTGTAVNYSAALAWYKKAAAQKHPKAIARLKLCETLVKAHAGDKEAQYELGLFYLNDRHGAGKNPAEAVKWLKKAAEAGHPQAQYEYAKCLYYGIGVERNYKLAAAFFDSAAKENVAQALFEKGWAAEYGRGRLRNKTDAFRNYLKSAEMGCAEAQYKIGMSLLKGSDRLGKDEGKALEWFEKAAVQGHVDAQYAAAVIFLKNQKYNDTAKWYRRAADQKHEGALEKVVFVEYLAWAHAGNREAQFKLAGCYEEGNNGADRNMSEAAKWYLAAAEKNHTEAQYAYAMCLKESKGVKRNINQALYWFRKAADSGHVKAQFQAGSILEEQEKYVDACKYYRKAAAQKHEDAKKRLPLCELHAKAVQGDAVAQFKLGEYYDDKDKKKSVSWYRKSGENNYTQAQFICGLYYRDGVVENGRVIVGKDKDSALFWFEKAAAHETFKEAQYQAALLCFEKERYDDAVKWCKKAANQGHKEAAELVLLYETHAKAQKNDRFSQYILAGYYEEGLHKAEKNQTTALKWYKASADLGYAPAQFKYGNYLYNEAKKLAEGEEYYRKAAEQKYGKAEYVYATILHGRKEYIKAFSYFKRSADNKQVDGQYWTGYYYFTALEIPQDYTAAVKYFQMAAANNHRDSIAILGACFLYGKGIAQDYKLAHKYLKNAAERGNFFAQYDLGLCYSEGLGVKKDYAKAVEWFELAGKSNYAPAFTELGRCFEQGLGVAVDAEKAKQFYRRAAELGDRDAVNALARF